MNTKLDFEIEPQPNDITCGPACLYSVYRYHGPEGGPEGGLQKVINDVTSLEEGGTLAVFLGYDALRNGFDATIFTYNLQVFDPSWFGLSSKKLIDKLKACVEAKDSYKVKRASSAYVQFLEAGGKLQFRDLTSGLIRSILKREFPIIAGLSSTFLYRSPREIDLDDGTMAYDDINGSPTGHFVVIHGYDAEKRLASVADPLRSNPISPTQYYKVPLSRLVCSIMLGAITYDANMLIITPKGVKI